jgi:hydroxypyruvate isomerase
MLKFSANLGFLWQALAETDLVMLGLNTVRGDLATGENGLAALWGQEDEAERAIDKAVEPLRCTQLFPTNLYIS